MKNRNQTLDRHRISKDADVAIHQMINLKLCIKPGDNSEIRKDKEARKAALDDFLYRNGDRPRSKGPLRLCYEDLPELLEIVGITFKEVFNQISRDPSGESVDPTWATEAEKRMCAYCDMLSPARQGQVLTLVKGLLAPSFAMDEAEKASPILRLSKANALRAYCIGAPLRQMRQLGTVGAYQRRFLNYSYNALPLELFAFMARNCDVSLHWLLGLDDSIAVLAETGRTEQIMDLFCLLSGERQQMVLRCVESAVDKGGLL